jgi:type VI secretion system secreted protein VgrG
MTRFLELTPTSLFGDEAVLARLEGREEISRPYEFMLTIDSPKESIAPADVIGKPLGVKIDRKDGPPRFVHGYISHLWAGDFVMTEGKQRVSSRIYRARIVPWIWFMMRASRSFVYLPEKQEKSFQDIFDKLLERVKSYGHVQTWNDVAGASILKNRKTEHCVQYRETDFNFLSRTLERFGIYYYFKHEANKHTLVLSDKSNYPRASDAEVDLKPSISSIYTNDQITSWEHAYEFVSGKFEQTDYDFLQPSTSLKTSASKSGNVSLSNNSGYELYDYPNDYVDKGDGTEESYRRMEEEEIRFNTVQGESCCKSFTAGYKFKLKSHYSCPDEAGKSFLLTGVHHSASQPARSTDSQTSTFYSNRFVCVPDSMQYRPARQTPRPRLVSIQTAVVVGPKGEEIYTDEHGRVKVQFHWDREGRHDENTSCWIRVSQSHAGRGFGGIDIPRIGEEVIVSFVEGDPDRPLITGRVYHKESVPPFALPGEKTRSGMKTKTYKGKGFNELSMDDTPGKEQIRIHGQYNMDTVVENDETHKIGKNRTKSIGVDEVMTIGNNQKLKVGVNKTVDVGTDHTETIGANQNIKIASNQVTKIGANQTTTVASNQSNSVGSAKTETVGMMSNEMVGVMKTTNVGVAYSIISGAAMNTAVGFVSAEEVGMTKKIIVGSKLEIIVGASKLVMEAGGKVTIEGTEFLFSAKGNVKINGSIIDLN